MARLPAPPDLVWDEEGAPYARTFGDIYFSKAGGLDETRAVFLEGCALPERWRGAPRFSILELGFGTGLNALAIWAAWEKSRAAGAVLHFVSIEAFPMAAADAARALAQFPILAPYAERLIAVWPARARAVQRLWFDGFALTLICADAEAALEGLEGRFDAVFLDGFAPARNDAMWSPRAMGRIAALCAPAARLATYSVAGAVRGALTDAGFVVEKKPGFGGKKQRLEARIVAARAPSPTLWPYAPAARAARVAIIGGGIAGACAAAAFVRRRFTPTIYDQGGDAPGPRALLMPRLDRDELAPARLYRAAYLEALRVYGALGALDAIGVEERPSDEADAALLADIAGDPPFEDDLLRAHGAGLFHPRAGLVSPAALIEQLSAGAERKRVRVSALTRVGDRWRLDGEDGGVGEADIVVLCAGASLGSFTQCAWLPLEYSRGQLDWGVSAAPAPRRAIASGAYMAPYGDQILFGATFDSIDRPGAVAPDADSTARNLAALARLAPDIAAQLTLSSAWAGVRVSANDRMPVAGLMPRGGQWAARFASMKDGRAPADMSEPPPAHEGLYVIGALGARGFSLAPILGERIAAEALGEPQTLDRGVLEAIHPARFLVRALKRGQKLDL